MQLTVTNFTDGSRCRIYLEARPLNVNNHVGCARPVVRQPLCDVAQLLHIACIGPCNEAHIKCLPVWDSLAINSLKYRH